MNRFLSCAAVAALFSTVLGGCAAAQGQPEAAAPPAVPAALQPPAGQSPFASLRATGVQIYECARKADAPGGFAWQFRAPEAQLADASGRVVGRHFAGPSWAADDGSTVVGKTSASAPSPRAGAIPWLLLAVQSRSGHGLLEHAASVQRVETAGGVAPAAACGPANEGQVERVAYSALYVFWQPQGS
jgi:hypothetical protein